MTSEEFRLMVAGNIRRIRKINNLTQMALAEKADISVGYLCDLESGNKWGTPETIVKLASSLNVEPGQFFERDNQKPDNADDLLMLGNILKKTIDDTIENFVENYKNIN